MKIKQKPSLHYPNPNQKQVYCPTTPIKSSNSTEAVSSRHQMRLPTQYQLCRQLINELGIQSKEQAKKFKNNFKVKYQKHMEMLSKHNEKFSRFKKSEEQHQLNKEQQKQEMRGYLSNRQVQVEERLKKIAERKDKKAKDERQKWQRIVNRNKNQYIKNLQNSMQLVKKWENKLEDSLDKKNQYFNKIAMQSQLHNEYVNNICERSRIQQSIEAEENILKLEKQLKRSKKNSMKAKTIAHHENPEDRKFSERQSKLSKNINNSLLQKYRTAENTPFLKQRSKSIASTGNKLSQISIRNKSPLDRSERSNLSKTSSQQHLQMKHLMDCQNLQKSLLKNVIKQQRISEARYLKSFQHQAKLKRLKKKQQEIEHIHKYNLSKLQQTQAIRNSKLNNKFQQNRLWRNYKEALTYVHNAGGISLPIITVKKELPNSTRDQEEVKNNSFTKQLKIKINSSLTLDSPIKTHQPSVRSKMDQIYLTQISQYNVSSKNDKGSKLNRKINNKHYFSVKNNFHSKNKKKNPQDADNTGKYNRLIMQKLRSLSLINSIKYKQYTQEIKSKQKSINSRILTFGSEHEFKDRDRERKKQIQLQELLKRNRRKQYKTQPNPYLVRKCE